MKESELRVVPKKNYFILAMVIIVTILLLFYYYLIENPDTIIYVSVLENNEIREFEKKFKKAFKNDEINCEILYMDVTNEISDKNIKNDLMNKYGISKDNIPIILVIRDGIIRNTYSIKDNDYNISLLKNYLNNIDLSQTGDLNG